MGDHRRDICSHCTERGSGLSLAFLVSLSVAQPQSRPGRGPDWPGVNPAAPLGCLATGAPFDPQGLSFLFHAMGTLIVTVRSTED